ncbi:MAG: hypothetical protein ACJAZN_001371, partial [Planctomycetota bacterium]
TSGLSDSHAELGAIQRTGLLERNSIEDRQLLISLEYIYETCRGAALQAS